MPRRSAHAAEDISAADDDADLHTHADDGADILGDLLYRIRIKAVLGISHERLARQLQEHALIEWLTVHRVLGVQS
jgi:hypothetical protein